MKILVSVDSKFGNTKKVAEYILDFFAKENDFEISLKNAGEVATEDIKQAECLIIGGPTHAMGMSQANKDLVKKIEQLNIKNKPLATFDTKFRQKFFGSGAVKMAKKFRKAKLNVITDPLNIIVNGTRGPLEKDWENKTRKYCEEIAKLLNFDIRK